MSGLNKLTLAFLLFMQCTLLSAQGMLFNGMESSIENRTSYDVFVSRTPEFENILKVEFSFSIYRPSDFGYILRIKNNAQGRIFNLLYSGENWNSPYPLRLNEEGKSSIIRVNLPHEYFKTGKWVRISLEFKMNEGNLMLKVDDHVFETNIDSMDDKWIPEINFGKSDYMIDVPSMAIKDLVVADERIEYRFPLNETEGNNVKEMNGSVFGQVSNPQWLSRKSYNWHEAASFTSYSKAGVNYDPYSKSVLYFNADSVYVYNLLNKISSKVKYSETCPVNLYLGSSFINPRDSLLYVYEPYTENRNDSVPTVASYDAKGNTWSVRSYDDIGTRFHHHSSIIHEARGRLIMFGGFGNMVYNGEFYSYSLDHDKWQKEPLPMGDRIHPRYFTSLGYDPEGDALYIFGGMGNESGEQIVGRRYFYDLHRVDLKTGENKQMWGKETELDWREENMVPVRNMVVTDDGFYTVCYPEFYTNSYLQLYYFDFKTATYTKFSNKVPIRSDKMSTNANLYFDDDLHQMILTVMESSDDIQSSLKVYTLAYPPLTEDEYNAMAEKSDSMWIIVIISSLALTALVAAIVLRNRRKVIDISETAYTTSGRKRYYTEQKPNSIRLFGGFSALDTNGNDVPFPFQQKKLLCLILKYSLDSGISSHRLSKIMWPDKSEDKVKNSRGVAINHLRKLLDNFHGVSLVYEDSHFKLQISEDFSCDWVEFKKESVSQNPDFNRIMSIAASGKFMPFIEDPVFDSFKETTETTLINILCAELPKIYAAKQYQVVVDMAEIVSHADPMNEQVLGLQLNALVKMKRTEDALVRYAAFVKEYKASYDADYERDFKSFIHVKS